MISLFVLYVYTQKPCLYEL